jgi:hypothetical protein
MEGRVCETYDVVFVDVSLIPVGHVFRSEEDGVRGEEGTGERERA